MIDRSSRVTALASVQNTSPFPISTIAITDPSPTAAGQELSKVDIDRIRLVVPPGATAVQVTGQCSNGTSINLTRAPTPATQTINPICPGGSFATSVTATYTGTFATNATGRLGLNGVLNGGEDDADVDDGIRNCADATASASGVSSAAATACAALDLEPAFSQVRGTKSAQLATLLPGLPRLFNLSFTNSGTIPATNLVMADPVDPTSPNSIFRDAGLFGLVLPATPAGGVAEIYDPDAGGYVPYNEADTALLERSLGFRVTVPSVPAGRRTRCRSTSGSTKAPRNPATPCRTAPASPPPPRRPRSSARSSSR